MGKRIYFLFLLLFVLSPPVHAAKVPAAKVRGTILVPGMEKGWTATGYGVAGEKRIERFLKQFDPKNITVVCHGMTDMTAYGDGTPPGGPRDYMLADRRGKYCATFVHSLGYYATTGTSEVLTSIRGAKLDILDKRPPPAVRVLIEKNARNIKSLDFNVGELEAHAERTDKHVHHLDVRVTKLEKHSFHVTFLPYALAGAVGTRGKVFGAGAGIVARFSRHWAAQYRLLVGPGGRYNNDFSAGWYLTNNLAFFGGVAYDANDMKHQDSVGLSFSLVATPHITKHVFLYAGIGGQWLYQYNQGVSTPTLSSSGVTITLSNSYSQKEGSLGRIVPQAIGGLGITF